MKTSLLPAVATTSRTRAVAALATAGVAWGTSVPLSKAALGAAIAALPVAALTEGLPPAPHPGGAGLLAVLAVVVLAAVGTLTPFTLFAYGQRQVSAEVAGAFLNLEPLVGALAGVVAFGDPAGPRLLAGGVAILAGIVMSSVSDLPAGSHRVADPPLQRERAGSGGDVPTSIHQPPRRIGHRQRRGG